MSKRPEQPPFTLETVIHTAKAVILKHGSHIPTVIATDKGQAIMTQIEDLHPTHEGRKLQLFTLGLVLALSGEIGVLQQAFFISEGWMNAAQAAKAAQTRPSEDPQRREVLLVAHMDVPTRKSDLVVMEMIRNKKGKLTRLEDFQQSKEESITVENPLLLAFVRGFVQGRAGNVH